MGAKGPNVNKKKEGKGNGNSVINNHERGQNSSNTATGASNTTSKNGSSKK